MNTVSKQSLFEARTGPIGAGWVVADAHAAWTLVAWKPLYGCNFHVTEITLMLAVRDG